MRFSHAQNGIKLMLTAQIIGIIGSFIGFLAYFIAKAVTDVAQLSEEANQEMLTANFANVALASVLMFLSIIISVVVYVLMIIGAGKAGEDEPNFQKAFLVMLIGTIAYAVSFLFADNIVSVILNLIFSAGEIIGLVFITGGLKSLAAQLGDEKLTAFVRGAGRVLAVKYALDAVEALIRFIVNILPSPPITSASLSNLLTFPKHVLDLICFIILIIMLGKTKKALAA